MTIRQKNKMKLGALLSGLVAVATLCSFLVKPLWGMETQIQTHDVRLGRQQEAIERIDRRDERIEHKVDKILERVLRGRR